MQKSKEKTVRDVIEEELNPSNTHGITVSNRSGDSVTCVVVSDRPVSEVSDDLSGFDVLDIRNLIIDLSTDNVIIGDGCWMPTNHDHLGNLTKIMARAQQLAGTAADEEPITDSAESNADIDLLLDRTVETDKDRGQDKEAMRRAPGIDPSREWGYNLGPPPEVETVAEAMEAVGEEPGDHLIRLKFGKKSPHISGAVNERTTMPVAELRGNYGIEVNPVESGLLAIDVDYPDNFPDNELPETLSVSSPHGTDDRRHLIYYCSDKQAIAEEFDAWAIQGVEWGELWIGSRYVAGPGSQLSAYGCDNGDHKVDNEGACEVCSDTNGGYYQLLGDNNNEIAEVSPETIIDLVSSDDDYERRTEGTNADAPSETDRVDTIAGEAEICDNCGEAKPIEELDSFTVAGNTQFVCDGGC